MYKLQIILNLTPTANNSFKLKFIYPLIMTIFIYTKKISKKKKLAKFSLYNIDLYILSI